MTAKELITHWAHAWTHLPSWQARFKGKPLTVEVKPWTGTTVTGLAWSHQRRIRIYLDETRLPWTLATVVHEIAHCAEPDADHGPAWRRAFSTAIGEITGTPMQGSSRAILDNEAHHALLHWWHNKGHAFAWSLQQRKAR